MPLKQKKALLIVNPIAGKQAAKNNIFKIMEVLSKKYDLTVHITESATDAKETAAQAQGFDAVICCGGDGTLGQTVAGLLTMKERPDIGYLPCGTANDVATTLKLSRDLSKSAKQVIDGTPKPHDVGTFNGKPFIYVASFGTFSKVSYETPQDFKNIFGHMAYLISGIGDLANLCSEDVTVVFDRKARRYRNITLLLVNNTASIGGLAKLNSNTYCLDDGKFELILIKKPKDIGQLQNVFFNVLNGNYNGRDVIVHHVSKAQIRLDHPVAWTLDGEFGGNHDKVTIEVLNKAVNIIR